MSVAVPPPRHDFLRQLTILDYFVDGGLLLNDQANVYPDRKPPSTATTVPVA
jgi:hypothetical protein